MDVHPLRDSNTISRKPSARKLTKTEIEVLVRQLKDIVAVLATADPEDRRAILRRTSSPVKYGEG